MADLPGDGHMFHVRNLEGFLGELKLRSDSQRPFPKRGMQIINLDKVRERIDAVRLKYSPASWIPLKEIAEGLYCEDLHAGHARLMSWWTNSILKQDNILQQIYRLGIPKDWLNEDCVLVRCSINPEIRAQARVPSVLDGFSSEIFMPEDYTGPSLTGRAIDIRSSPLQLGDIEVVMGPISVEYLEIQLIKIPKGAPGDGAIYSDDPAFLQNLESYYRDCLR